MAENLKQKAARGLIWKFIEQGGTQLIQFIAGIYIARKLSPEDYGLVGMMAIFLGISQMFIDSGFRATLIQKGTDVTHDHYNVVFLFNLTVSILFYLLIFFLAPVIADFYTEPRLLWVARILGLNLIFLSLSIIHQTILEKKLNFRTLTKIRLVSIFISVVVGIVLAVMNFGVWALVLMTISESFIRTLLVWLINKWLPSFAFNRKIFKELFANGVHIFFAGLLQQISENLYEMVIGKLFTTTDVGFFSQGKKLQRRVGDFINSSIQGVMYPVQTLMKDDIPRLKNALRKNVKVTTLVVLPALMGLMAVAKPFIILFLTEKWLPSVYYLQVLCVSGAIYVIGSAASSFILPLGKFSFFSGFRIFNSALLVVIIVVGILFNVDLKILVLGKIIHEVVNFAVFMYFSEKLIGYRFIDVIVDIYPSLIYSLLMVTIVYLLGYFWGISFIVLLLQVVIGGSLYLVLNYLFNRSMFAEILSVTHSIIRK